MYILNRTSHTRHYQEVERLTKQGAYIMPLLNNLWENICTRLAQTWQDRQAIKVPS
ncbi:hypothetical protein BDW60DRAFT_194949 [Aspergillus nidulans var. acristatus]